MKDNQQYADLNNQQYEDLAELKADLDSALDGIEEQAAAIRRMLKGMGMQPLSKWLEERGIELNDGDILSTNLTG
jgi:hypothetical protein